MLNGATTRKTWRAWLLLAVACWACVVPAWAFAPGVSVREAKTRVGFFCANYGEARPAQPVQVAETHREKCAARYDSASGPTVGLYYLRARYLNPDSGRFWSMDGYEGGSSDPMSLHKYLYANANPVMFVDPSGYAILAQFTAAQAIAFNLAVRLIPVATKLTWFAAEVAGVSTGGLLLGRGVVALGTAAQRSVPPGLTTSELIATATKLTKGVAIGSHRYVRKLLAGTGGQSGHLNQSAAFPAAVADDALAITMQGSTSVKGTEHWRFHRVLEEFWDKFRNNPFRKPTNGEYGEALRRALAETDVNAGAIEDLVRLAEKSRVAAGYFDGPGGLPPVVPGPIPMPK